MNSYKIYFTIPDGTHSCEQIVQVTVYRGLNAQLAFRKFKRNKKYFGHYVVNIIKMKD